MRKILCFIPGRLSLIEAINMLILYGLYAHAEELFYELWLVPQSK